MPKTILLPEPIVGKDFDRTIKIDVDEPNPDKPGYVQTVRTLTWSEFAKECDRCVMSIPAIAHNIEWHGLDSLISMGCQGSPRPNDQIPNRWRLEVGWEVGGSEGYHVHVYILAPLESALQKISRNTVSVLEKMLPNIAQIKSLSPDLEKIQAVLNDLRDAESRDDNENRLFRHCAWSAKFFDYNVAVATTLQLTRALMWHGSGMDDGLRDLISGLSERVNA